MPLTEKQKKGIAKVFDSVIKHQLKYDTNGQEVVAKTVTDEKIMDDIYDIIYGKEDLTKAEIEAYWKKYSNHRIVAPLLMECKNMPPNLIQSSIENTIRFMSASSSRWYSAERESLARGIFSAQMTEKNIKENVHHLWRLFQACNYRNYMMFDLNGKTVLEMAKNAYYNLKEQPQNVTFILQSIRPDESLSEKQLQNEFKNMLDFDVESEIDRMGIENGGEVIEARNNGIIMNPFTSDAIINTIFESGEIDYQKLPERLTDGMAEEAYEIIKATILSPDGVSGSGANKNTAITNFMVLCKSGKLTPQMQFDFFNTLRVDKEVGSNSWTFERLMSMYLYDLKGVEYDTDTLKMLTVCAGKGMKTRLFLSDNIPDDKKRECIQEYIDITRKNKILKSNKSLMLTLSTIGRLEPLNEKRYEEILNSKLEDDRFKELYNAIATSATTPIDVLEKMESRDPENINIKIAIYANKNDFSSKTVDDLMMLITRDYLGNNRKTTKNIEILDIFIKHNPKVDVQKFINYMRDLCDRNPKFADKYGENLNKLEELTREYIDEFGANKEEYIKSVAPSQYYIKKISDYTEKISTDSHDYASPLNRTMKNAILTVNEYEKLVEEKTRKPRKAKDEVSFEYEMESIDVKPKVTNDAPKTPVFLDDFLADRD